MPVCFIVYPKYGDHIVRTFHIRSNRSCPRCGRAGSFADTLRAQWGYCDGCKVKWPILHDQYPRNPYQDLTGSEESLADYREVAPRDRPLLVTLAAPRPRP
jgi:hypothetical protein